MTWDYTNDGIWLEGRFYEIPARCFYKECYE
jgi:hypothetical protein